MPSLQMYSWNVNGLRAAVRKGLLDWLDQAQPDILAVQETKLQMEQVPAEVRQIDGYHSYFACANRRGYSGVGLWTRLKPRKVSEGFGVEEFDCEGRTLAADYGDFLLYNVYFPNGGQSPERLQYKYDFYDAFLEHLEKRLRRQRHIIICGDVNTAHREIDLARPKENENNTGFLPAERAWIDRLLAAGFHDTFRAFDDRGEQYTWWDYKTRARERNVGWRIDYFFVSAALRDRLQAATIHPNVMGSDHCPISMTLATEASPAPPAKATGN